MIADHSHYRDNKIEPQPPASRICLRLIQQIYSHLQINVLSSRAVLGFKSEVSVRLLCEGYSLFMRIIFLF